MRSDYTLYAVAIIFFIMTGVVLAFSVELKQLWLVTTAVLGLAFIGLGYSQRPKLASQTIVSDVVAPLPPPPAQPTALGITKEEKQEEKPELIVESSTPTTPLTKVEGIGEKRAAQLRALRVNSVEDLAEASAKDLATKLKISPKITGKWIENAKRIIHK